MWMGVRVGVGVDGCEGWGRCGWMSIIHECAVFQDNKVKGSLSAATRKALERKKLM